MLKTYIRSVTTGPKWVRWFDILYTSHVGWIPVFIVVNVIKFPYWKHVALTFSWLNVWRYYMACFAPSISGHSSRNETLLKIHMCKTPGEKACSACLWKSLFIRIYSLRHSQSKLLLEKMSRWFIYYKSPSMVSIAILSIWIFCRWLRGRNGRTL